MSHVQELPEERESAPGWSEPGKAVVVGADGSSRNRAALAWAAAEATLTRRPLVLVHALDERGIPNPFHGLETDDQHAWHLLDGAEAQLREAEAGLVVRKDVVLGPVATSLLERSADEAEIVVGRRGAGTFRRLLIGSTSLDVASRADVPVVVVPADWPADGRASRPVVVGLARSARQRWVLEYAFTQAQVRRAPLIAAHGREVPELDGDVPRRGGATPAAPSAAESLVDLEDLLEPCRAEFPDVEVSVVERSGHPLAVLLDEVGPSQLLVLGRRRDGRRGGFAFGSVAHGVLHYAEVPVAIVPPAD